MRVSAAVCGSLGAAVLIAIAGCSPQQAGAVAVVGDDRLTHDEVRSEIQDLSETLPDGMDLTEEDRTAIAAGTVGGWVAERLLDAIAEDDGIDVSQDALDAKVDELGGPQALAANGIGPDSVDEFAKFQILMTAMLPADEEAQLQAEVESQVREQGTLQGLDGDELEEFVEFNMQQLWPQTRGQEVQQRISTRVEEQMDVTDVDVSGRYGVFDEQTLGMHQGASASTTAGWDPDEAVDTGNPFEDMMELQGASGE
ncbi:SurA N-terminal domain-containing protein [Spiractinospora alimapuensis]|uniref:SurA N-terminal domain-containing protein n=1 Tax=Spiractinospora alimapuensis TaxID=2820884 RepID=UPI001F396E39|nr:SurA N-terminal domain-containing protein [Spiractinospora alimapuensis]QVQ51410.1 SurA N-terminal domain-containing protein [Spiractinospora alimapuensis]